jgi:hypothetical protein
VNLLANTSTSGRDISQFGRQIANASLFVIPIRFENITNSELEPFQIKTPF